MLAWNLLGGLHKVHWSIFVDSGNARRDSKWLKTSPPQRDVSSRSGWRGKRVFRSKKLIREQFVRARCPHSRAVVPRQLLGTMRTTVSGTQKKTHFFMRYSNVGNYQYNQYCFISCSVILRFIEDKIVGIPDVSFIYVSSILESRLHTNLKFCVNPSASCPSTKKKYLTILFF